MNETIKSILSRRSYKSYKPEQISEEHLQMILEAGKFAPSGMNRQPWHFTVIQSKEKLKEIDETARRSMPKNMSAPPSPPPGPDGKPMPPRKNPMETAPTLIIISGDTEVFTTPCDCVLAMENMFIAAESLGIGSNWLHAIVKDLFYSEEGAGLKKELLPEGYVPYAAAVFGYKDGEPMPRQPRKEGTVTIIR